jgi:hypothetical protein
MRVLIGCEFSGIVREAFRARGHDAWSCDLLPAEDGSAYHIQGDVREVLDLGWDLGIFHPPCDHVAVSGAAHFAAKRADGRQQQGIAFFMEFTRTQIPKVAIENPVGIMSSVYRKPNQIIQPYEYGHPESKKTCLWLTGLPLLQPTNILPLPASGRWENQTPSGQNKLGPSADRWKIRSRTYQGIADAMAEQWGVL